MQADEERVSPLAEALRARGYVVEQHDDEAAIDSARAVIVVWSAHSIASSRSRARAARALDQDKLAQIALDPSRAPMPFNMVHSAALGDWAGEADHHEWRQLLGRLAALCGDERDDG
ncbi:MAG: hypothetical protein H7X93_05215 [Sphingomonadaceae bacterium]|nr:hypothetical protein [Sphingomonadaceae bacterium]